MATTLEAIRAKLAAMENKGGNKSSGGGDNALYPHWNIKEGEQATIRFLPDDDPDNTFFWVERQMIKLHFPGVVGGEQKEIMVQVPCGEMYGDPCPILSEVRPWFKDPSLEDMARKYWKKRSYIFQGFVVDNPIADDSTPENPIRRFVMSPQIFNVIKSALMDPDMENIPTDYLNGTDFRVVKTTKGNYADYSTSTWARRERALTAEEATAIDANGLNDLKAFLPTRPTAEHYQAIKEMFAASVDGELYDPVKWGNFYRPFGMDVPANAEPAGGTTPVATPSKPSVTETETDDIPFDTAEKTTKVETQPVAEEKPAEETETANNGTASVNDMLAMIRSRAQS